MLCHRCDAIIELASGDRLGFRDECTRCGADLHVCRNCELYDPGAYNQCREPQAERVGDRERANRCEWFRPAGNEARSGATRPQQATREALDALFRKKGE